MSNDPKDAVIDLSKLVNKYENETKVICLRCQCQYHSGKDGCCLSSITIGEHSGLCINFN